MSFDRVCRVLDKRDIWIRVLDTQGINVWCAAGKGTVDTQELIALINANRLSDLVAHRRLVLPQLETVGVSAHQVKRASGFKVVYGPVMAEDLPRYLDAGRRATPETRRKRFPIQERAALIPIELVAAIKTGGGHSRIHSDERSKTSHISSLAESSLALEVMPSGHGEEPGQQCPPP